MKELSLLIATPYPKAVGVSYAHAHSPNKYRNKNKNKNINNLSSSLSTHHCSKPPLQTRPPLQTPKLHISIDKTGFSTQQLMISHNTTNDTWSKSMKSSTSTTPTCTVSDVLCLMDSLGLHMPPDIYASLIEECTVTMDSTQAVELNSHIARSGLRPSLPLLNRLLLMNVSVGLLDTARQLFDKMTLKDFISWATMIVGYVNNADYDEAMGLFVKMQHQFNMLEFPTWIIVCVLNACVCSMNMELGMQVHGCLLKLGKVNDLFLTSSLINFYGKFKCLEGAEFVFNQLSHHNTMTWTARMISNCREEHFWDVVSDFKEMGRAGIKKSTSTFSSVLRACGRVQDDGLCGQQVHANAIKLGIDTDTFVHCGLVDMYGRSGLLRDAKMVFEMINDEGNIASWNAMVTGYVLHGFYIEAIKLLYKMKAAGMQPPESLLNEVKIACGGNAIESRTEH